MRLLVIEDEDRLSGILKSKLGDIGFTVDIAGSAADAGIALELINYDAAVLDIGLPDGDGLAVLTAARAAGKALPILILTARDAAKRHGLSRRYIRRLVGVAFLSPQPVEAMLHGGHSVELTATRLTELDLPLDWTEQHNLLAG